MADSDSDDSDIVIEELPSGAPPAAAADAESSDDDIVITGACPAPALFPPAPARETPACLRRCSAPYARR